MRYGIVVEYSVADGELLFPISAAQDRIVELLSQENVEGEIYSNIYLGERNPKSGNYVHKFLLSIREDSERLMHAIKVALEKQFCCVYGVEYVSAQKSFSWEKIYPKS